MSLGGLALHDAILVDSAPISARPKPPSANWLMPMTLAVRLIHRRPETSNYRRFLRFRNSDSFWVMWMGLTIRGQTGFWDLNKRYEWLSAVGDSLEKLNSIIPWPRFEKPLAKALKRSGRSNGGRPPFPAVLMFKILVLQAPYNLSDDQAEFVIQDSLSFMQFLVLGLSAEVPDAKMIWLFRESLVRAGAIDNQFARFDKHLSRSGNLAKGGQIIDATSIKTPSQHNNGSADKVRPQSRQGAGRNGRGDEMIKRFQHDSAWAEIEASNTFTVPTPV